jgi:hypothetical protein
MSERHSEYRIRGNDKYVRLVAKRVNHPILVIPANAGIQSLPGVHSSSH